MECNQYGATRSIHFFVNLSERFSTFFHSRTPWPLTTTLRPPNAKNTYNLIVPPRRLEWYIIPTIVLYSYYTLILNRISYEKPIYNIYNISLLVSQVISINYNKFQFFCHYAFFSGDPLIPNRGAPVENRWTKQNEYIYF